MPCGGTSVSLFANRNGSSLKSGVLIGCLLLLTSCFLEAQTAIDEDAPWPRVRSTNGNTVTLHLPQVERWTSNSFVARAAVEVKPAGAKKALFGVAWLEAHGAVDRANRLVTLDRFEVTKGRFPDTTDNGSNALAIVREIVPSGARTISLDYLITALGFVQAAARKGTQGLKHDPPQIMWATNRTVLVIVDGEPVLRPIPNSTLERVINTPELLVHDKAGNRFYLAGDGLWFSAETTKGPWLLAQTPPADVAALSPAKSTQDSASTGQPPPRIIISTSPAELVRSDSLPDYKPIRGTALQYAADSDSQLFFHSTERAAYLLLSGRWFKAASLQGPWNYVAPRDLPSDFAKIPPNSPQAVVLASVPDTLQAELAMVASSVSTTATVKRREAEIELKYDGEPKFKPIEGTSMSYAVNAQPPVIKTGDEYYAVDDGVWFIAKSPTGPWEVATEVPEEIYTIPPSSPVYYATFAHVYDSDEENVEVGYTPGYTGTYEDDETVVYGTGWYYDPWYGDYYYGWGWTWGYGYWYVPWYGWWVWQAGWGDRGALREALIENIYDRWQSRPGVTPHDRVPGAASTALRSRDFTGHPALYGRFSGSTRPARLALPANTIALNPYTRPKAPARAGEIPNGAQLLTTVRQAPGGGRDLYASPDGNVYRRKSDGWYRRQAGGNWSLAAPIQGKVERGQVASAKPGQPAAAGNAVRITPGANAPAARTQPRGDRVPNVGGEARMQEVADLERQYYARAVSQMRTQNARPAQAARPARGGGGGRRR
jgi:hypothetical protein